MRVSSTLSLGVGSWSRNTAQTRQLSGRGTFPFTHTHGFKSVFASYFQGKITWHQGLGNDPKYDPRTAQVCKAACVCNSGRTARNKSSGGNPRSPATPGCPSRGGGVQTSTWRTAPGDWALVCWFIVYSSKFRTTPPPQNEARLGGQFHFWKG